MKKRTLIMVIFIFLVGEGSTMANESKLSGFINSVAVEIAKLKKSYPQLERFSVEKNTDIENLKIQYNYHTHAAERSTGWISGVPNPDSDGIWFYIDLHAPDSTAQIHTQPITGKSIQFGNKIVCFLILEGASTRSVERKIIAILEKNGATSQ